MHVITCEEMPPGCRMTAAVGLLMLVLQTTSLEQSGDGESADMGERAVSHDISNVKSECRINWQHLLLYVIEIK